MSDLLATQSGPWLYGPTVEEDANGTKLTTYVYTGTLAECTAQRDICRTQGAKYLSLGPKGDGNYELRVSYPWGDGGQIEAPQDVHDLQTTVQQVSIWSRSRVASLITPAANLQKAREVFKAWNDGKYSDNWGALEADVNAKIADSTQRARVKAFLDQVIVKGLDSAKTYLSVYRRVLTASNPQQIQASREGEGQIWTTAEVMAWEGLTAAWYFVLPSSSVWLKARAEITSAARGRTQISYSYEECEIASQFAYDRRGTATDSNYTWTA